MTAARVSRREFLRGRARRSLSAHFAAESPPSVASSDPSAAQVARLDPGRCLAAASQICTVCKERCGARGAITMRGLLPQISSVLCTGCGSCIEACPAPEPALRLVTREETI